MYCMHLARPELPAHAHPKTVKVAQNQPPKGLVQFNLNEYKRLLSSKAPAKQIQQFLRASLKADPRLYTHKFRLHEHDHKKDLAQIAKMNQRPEIALWIHEQEQGYISQKRELANALK